MLHQTASDAPQSEVTCMAKLRVKEPLLELEALEKVHGQPSRKERLALRLAHVMCRGLCEEKELPPLFRCFPNRLPTPIWIKFASAT